jgi:protein TonB
MSSFSRSLIGSLILHGGFFLGTSCLMIQESQWGVDAGESGAAGAITQEVEVSLTEPEPERVTEPEPVPEIEPIVSDFTLPEATPKLREENRPEQTPKIQTPKVSTSVPKPPSSSPSGATASTALATGSGGARLANRADYLRNPPPVYPSDAKKRGEEGTVVLWVELTEEGRVESTTVSASSGYDSLDRAALDAVRRWRFQPAKVGGIGIRSTVKVPIRFDLEKS